MNLFTMSEAEKERLRPCTTEKCRGTFAGMEAGKWYHLYPNKENMARFDWKANPFKLLDEEYRQIGRDKVRNVTGDNNRRTKPIRRYGEESNSTIPGYIEFEVEYWNKDDDGSGRGPFKMTLTSQDPETQVYEVPEPHWLARTPGLYQPHIHPEDPDQVQVSVRLDDGTMISEQELKNKTAFEEAKEAADAAKKKKSIFSRFTRNRGGKRKSNRRNIKSSTKKAKGRKGRKSRKNKSKAKK